MVSQYTDTDHIVIRGCEVDGVHTDCRLRSGRVAELGPSLSVGDAWVIDAQGGALLPGLHDHHMHLRAAAAARSSVDLSAYARLQEVSEATPHGSGWLRLVGFDDVLHGALDRERLDRAFGERPVRVQHVSGKLWVFNSAALAALPTAPVDVRLDVELGHLWRGDGWLGQALPHDGVAVHDYCEQLLRFGVTGVSDASFTNSQADEGWAESLPIDTYLLGDESVSEGPLKVMLDEDQLPELDGLIARIQCAHRRDRAVAFHCVTHIELVYALSALAAAGVSGADRIEHGAIVFDADVERMLALGVTVVTQPGFISDRGDKYQARLAAGELAVLYRYQSLLELGVPVICSSDAPYGPVSPWLVADAAVRRVAPGGQVMGARERVSPDTAMHGYLTVPDDPAGARRTVAPGLRSLCLLDSGWADACADFSQVTVTHTVHDAKCYVWSDAD